MPLRSRAFLGLHFPGERISTQSVGKRVCLRCWLARGAQEDAPRPPGLAVRAGRPRASSGGRAPSVVSGGGKALDYRQELRELFPLPIFLCTNRFLPLILDDNLRRRGCHRFRTTAQQCSVIG
jgi:hypothetical protein